MHAEENRKKKTYNTLTVLRLTLVDLRERRENEILDRSQKRTHVHHQRSREKHTRTHIIAEQCTKGEKQKISDIKERKEIRSAFNLNGRDAEDQRRDFQRMTDVLGSIA